MARKMVCEWGMTDELGAVSYGQEDEPIFLAREIARHQNYSEDTARRIDGAIRTILDRALAHAEKIIAENRAKLEQLSEELLAKETLLDAEVRALIGIPA